MPVERAQNAGLFNDIYCFHKLRLLQLRYNSCNLTTGQGKEQGNKVNFANYLLQRVHIAHPESRIRLRQIVLGIQSRVTCLSTILEQHYKRHCTIQLTRGTEDEESNKPHCLSNSLASLAQKRYFRPSRALWTNPLVVCRPHKS